MRQTFENQQSKEEGIIMREPITKKASLEALTDRWYEETAQKLHSDGIDLMQLDDDNMLNDYGIFKKDLYPVAEHLSDIIGKEKCCKYFRGYYQLDPKSPDRIKFLLLEDARYDYSVYDDGSEYYTATALDGNGNFLDMYWKITNPGAPDGADVCDWPNPDHIAYRN
jgi:hypothetical protein